MKKFNTVVELIVDLLIGTGIIVFVYKMGIFNLFGNRVVELTFAGIFGWLLGYQVVPYIRKCILDTLIRRYNSTKVE